MENVYKTCQLKTESDIFNTPLWFNSKLLNSNLVKNNWNNQGISVIGHIVDSNLQILKQEESARERALCQLTECF